ncbi:MAG: phage recombination protein Bet [Gammaproteobacteria bacterium]|nr:phage recombination protein Bet [Gammaproteobacteria bacterium]
MNELTKTDVTANLPPVQITREDITKHFCPLASEKEVAMALAIVKSLKLNPFLREVHFIKYSQKDIMAIVVGYEVYLKRAERTGKLNGWKAGINTAENYAWVKIWRKDWAEPFEWEVNLSEFNKKQSTWNQIPSFMGRKVAIAQGFRLAFPDELGGMPYSREEHEVYDIDRTPEGIKPEVQIPKEISQQPSEAPRTQPEPSQNSKEADLLALAIKAFKGKKSDFLNWLGREWGCEDINEITDEQLPKFKEALLKITDK